MKSHYLYMNKDNRDVAARELQAQGYMVRRSSTSNQLLHPMYLEDYPRQLSPAECGFGNTIYKTYFAKLYSVEIVYR